MMRIAKGTRLADGAVGQFPGQTSHHGNFQRLARIQWRQQSWQALRQHGFARAGRADHQKIVPAGRCDLERSLGGFLTLYVFQIRHGAHVARYARDRRRQHLRAFHVIDQRDQ